MGTSTVIECTVILLTGLSIVRGQSLTEKIPLGKSIQCMCIETERWEAGGLCGEGRLVMKIIFGESSIAEDCNAKMDLYDSFLSTEHSTHYIRSTICSAIKTIAWIIQQWPKWVYMCVCMRLRISHIIQNDIPLAADNYFHCRGSFGSWISKTKALSQFRIRRINASVQWLWFAYSRIGGHQWLLL